MSRLGGAFWFILVIATGMTNFLVKQTVQGLDDQLTQVKHKTIEDQKKIHDLTADWTFLNQPELLSDLNNRYVHLVAVSPKQVVTNLDSIPMRPAPPPEGVPPPVAQATAPVAPPPPIPVAVAVATPAPARAPATSLSLISVAHAATVRPAAAPEAAAAAPVHNRPPPAPQAPSLDALFAQVAGDR